LSYFQSNPSSKLTKSADKMAETQVDSCELSSDQSVAEEEASYCQLARRLCDLLLTGSGQIAPNELALAETALVDLLPFLPNELKNHFAARIAPLESAPEALLAALIDEPYSVSAPLLSEAQCLTACDLVRVAERGELAHRLTLATRRNLSRVVCEALSSKGEISVLQALLANESAKLSHRTLEEIARRSSADPELIMSLLHRQDLTPWLAHLMFWWADGEERSVILRRFAIDRRAIVDALSDAFDLDGLLETQSGALRGTYRLLRPARRLLDTDLETVLTNISADTAQFVLAEAAQISPTAAAWIIADEGGEPLAVLGKALGVSRNDFLSLATQLSAARLSGAYSENEMERSVALFDSITMDRADSILHYWDRIISDETGSAKSF
jgi:uncharacterized protein (DUF2336 family)